MTPSEWAELSRLAAKAAEHERKTYSNEKNYDVLRNVATYAGRMS